MMCRATLVSGGCGLRHRRPLHIDAERCRFRADRIESRDAILSYT
jgi:hypothetical protein